MNRSDDARNSHRHVQAWGKSAIRVILTNPRYTGRQVWNKQRKAEILIDFDDVALGHETKMRWNPTQAGSTPPPRHTKRSSTTRPSNRSRP
ncbi:hypothetical protein GCM10020358_59150 [Amorphoplanes nipponensis]|uniref:Recombinase domain-containing protein n=1 Tax=Actinoplanes nipponensis TaxID=135950 RepID=A0A919MEX0_9ACTN|nr:recombinase family protein [Actinoplanes nipponensis]GIE46894.1 hypothetical protein Ani05nite_04280 [Actinoplanes nipponensis]